MKFEMATEVEIIDKELQPIRDCPALVGPLDGAGQI